MDIAVGAWMLWFDYKSNDVLKTDCNAKEIVKRLIEQNRKYSAVSEIDKSLLMLDMTLFVAGNVWNYKTDFFHYKVTLLRSTMTIFYKQL